MKEIDSLRYEQETGFKGLFRMKRAAKFALFLSK